MNSLSLTQKTSFFHPSSHNIIIKNNQLHPSCLNSFNYLPKKSSCNSRRIRTCILFPKVLFPLATSGRTLAGFGRFHEGMLWSRTEGRRRLIWELGGTRRRWAFQADVCSLQMLQAKINFIATTYVINSVMYKLSTFIEEVFLFVLLQEFSLAIRIGDQSCYIFQMFFVFCKHFFESVADGLKHKVKTTIISSSRQKVNYAKSNNYLSPLIE